MKKTTNPCTTGPKHKWTWVRNVTKGSISASGAHFSLHGQYNCACGASKLGLSNHNGPDLRGLLGGK